MKRTNISILTRLGVHKFMLLGFILTFALSVRSQSGTGVDKSNPIFIGVKGPCKWMFWNGFIDVRNTKDYGDDNVPDFQSWNYQSPDIWYKFTITDYGNVFISTRGSGWDTFLYLFDANGNLVDYNDDGGCQDITKTWDVQPISNEWSEYASFQEAGITAYNLPPGDYYIQAEGSGWKTSGVLNLKVLFDIKDNSIADDSYLNLVRTWTPKSPQTNASSIINLPIKEVEQKTDYYDQLGRSLQTVIKQGSMESGSMPHDLVNLHYYDNLGQESRQYLPFATTDNNGYYKTDPYSAQSSFYQTQLIGQGETDYYSKMEFEESPLSRVKKVMAPGASWAGSNRGIGHENLLNTSLDGIRKWAVIHNAGGFGDYSTNDTYLANELTKKITIDEAGKQVIEFTDKSGLLILKKVQQTASPDMGLGSNHSGWLCTYFIYDDLNQLRASLQPKAVELLNGNGWQINQTILDEQCFRYEYDDLGNNIIKKVPGAAAVQMVYDQGNRLVMAQDGNMRLTHQWIYTKYDALGRSISSGLITDHVNYNNADYHRAQAAISSDYPNIGAYSSELLAETHYDDYNSIPVNLNTSLVPYNSTGFLTNYSAAPDYPQQIIKSDFTKGLITWTKFKVLGTSQFINTVNIYDNKGRIVQVQQYDESTSNKAIVTTQYNWMGQALRSLQKLEKGGVNAQTIETLNTYSYDELGRISETKKKIGNGIDKIIARNEYNALGQLKKKTVAPEYNNGTGLETLSYEYNIRGWLLGVNRNFAKDKNNNSNYFGFDLGYDKANITGIGNYANVQFNGNITGTVWKSRGDNEIRKFDFSYDALKRLTGADFNQYTGGNFNKDAKVDFSVSNISYDANGNIMTMDQMGLKGATSELIDKMIYSYENNNQSNKLAAVMDIANDKTSVLGDFKYDPATKTSIDYGYDANGNLTSDANKKISTITYNYLNLPQIITTDKGSIESIYDASGTRLKKIVHETGKPDKTTLYFGGAVYENDVLQFISNEEGRVRPLSDGVFVFDYFLKDHLGNVRMVLTEEQKENRYPALSFETANRANEYSLYENSDKALTARPQAMGDEANNGGSVQVLQKDVQTIGGGKLLKVMSGDVLNVKVDYYFASGSANNSNANGLQSALTNIIALLANGSANAALKGSSNSIATSLNTTPDFTGLLAQQDKSVYSGLPKAYLNILFFDEQFNFVRSGSQVIQVTDPDIKRTIVKSDISATKNGYVYVYVSNESNNLVYFDNLQITHTPGAILEETHYYPYGLKMAGISSEALNGLIENKYKFNEGTELNDDLGISMYETFYRGYDPQIGRFLQVDALSEFYAATSPYSFAFDNPVFFNDALGLEGDPTNPTITNPNAPKGDEENPYIMDAVFIYSNRSSYVNQYQVWFPWGLGGGIDRAGSKPDFWDKANPVMGAFGLASGIKETIIEGGAALNRGISIAKVNNISLIRTYGLTGAKYLKYSKSVGIFGSVVTTGYSGYKVYEQYSSGGLKEVFGHRDILDAGVGTAGVLAAIGVFSNPVGWGIGIGVLIYGGGTLIYDAINEK